LLLPDEDEEEDDEEEDDDDDDERGGDIVDREDNEDESSPESLAAGFAAGFFAGGAEPSALGFAFFAAGLEPDELPALLGALPSPDPPRFRLRGLDELAGAVAVGVGAGACGGISIVVNISMGPSTTVPDGALVEGAALLDDAGALLDGAGALVEDAGALVDGAGALFDGAEALLGGPEDEEPADGGLAEDEEPDEDLVDAEPRGKRRTGGIVAPVVPVARGGIAGPAVVPAAGGAVVEGTTKSEVPDPIPSPSLNSMPSYRYSSATVPDDEKEAFESSLPSPLPSPPTVAVFTTSDPDPDDDEDDDDPKVDNNCMRRLLANFLASDPLHSSSDSHFSTHAQPFAGSCEQAL
jgi:hypothetical protein